MQEENFSPQKSLEIIQTMIDKAKNTAADKSFYFLLWGWLIFIASILQFVLKVIVHYPGHSIVWNLMFIGVVISIFHSVREGKKRVVKTYVDEGLGHLWISIFIVQVSLVFIFSRIGWENNYTFFMLVYAIGSFVTGRSLKFSPLVWGAAGSWALAIMSTFSSFDYNILLSALAILLSNIIPGHLLRMQYKKQS